MAMEQWIERLSLRKLRLALSESWAFHGVLGPGIRLMRNLSTRTKLLVVVGLLSLPIVLLLVVEGGEVLQGVDTQTRSRSALREFSALAELNASMAPVLLGVIEVDLPGRAEDLGAALQREAQAFESLREQAQRSAGDDHHRRQLDRGLTALAERRTTMHNAMRGNAADAGMRAARRTAVLAYAKELQDLRRELAASWTVVADGDSVNHLLYDHTVQFVFQMLPATSRAAVSGQRILSGQNDPQRRRALLEASTEVRVLTEVAGPALDHLRRLGHLAGSDMGAQLQAIRDFVDASQRLADRAGGDGAAALDLEAAAGERRALGLSAAGVSTALFALQRAGIAAIDARLTVLQSESYGMGARLFLVSLVCVLIAGYLLLCTYHVLNKGLATLCLRIGRLGQGDLSQSARPLGSDEIGHAMGMLHDAVAGLRKLFDAVTQGVAAVSHASREVAMGNTGLSDRTGEMRSAIGSVAGSAQGSADAMDSCAQAVERASEHAREARANARRSSKGMLTLQQRMRALEGRSREINQMVSLMQTIAFQTKLLSLNASVEAARAGTAGKGFAVVAQEVRSLAARSEKAAGRIRDIVGASVKDIEEGSAVAGRATEAVRKTDDEIQAVNALITEVVQLTRDGMSQSQSVLGIARTVEDSVAGNVRLIDQLSGAAGSLRDQGDALRRSVRHFVLS